MRTANPTLRPELFTPDAMAVASPTMTVTGAALKTGVLLALCVVPATLTWSKVTATIAEAGGAATYGSAAPWIFGGMIVGLVFALITAFKPRAAPITAPLYAIAEGLFLGGISAAFEARFPGIVIQAVGLTFGVLASLLIMYSMGFLRATPKFRVGVMAATGGIFLVYIATWILGFFGIGIPFIHGSGLIGIGFSLFVVVIASMNLVLDFDFIERGAEAGAPKYMEWYGAFGLMVTLVWLYLEVLRLLAKLQSRD